MKSVENKADSDAELSLLAFAAANPPTTSTTAAAMKSKSKVEDIRLNLSNAKKLRSRLELLKGIRTVIYIYMHAHTYIHTYTHTFIHTYIHTYT